MAKHFIKTLVIFIGLILIGIVGVVLINYYDQDAQTASSQEAQIKTDQ